MSNCLNFESGPCGLFEVCIRSGKITSDNKMATTSIDLFADTTSFLKELITFNIFILCIGLVYVCTRLRNTIAQKIRARSKCIISLYLLLITTYVFSCVYLYFNIDHYSVSNVFLFTNEEIRAR